MRWHKMSLEGLRKNIDSIDNKIIELLAKRKELIKEIASIKKEQKKPIIDEEREQKIIGRLKKLSKEKNLDDKFIASLYKIIIENSREEQEE